MVRALLIVWYDPIFLTVIQSTVRALYDYRAQGPEELTIKEGDLVELSAGADGGQNFSDGWWEGMEWSYLNDD